MKAIVYTKYGGPDVLNFQQIEKPVPGSEEFLIRVNATTATAAEGMMRRGDTFISRVVLGLFKPRKKYQVLGLELAGVVEETGDKVKRLSKGEKVFGFTGFTPGAYAEYIRLPNKASVVKMPENLSFEEAASVVDGASTSFFFLKEKANIKRGQNVLIVGASGSIGVYAVQLAKHFGANVSGVCSSKNADLVKQLGAQKVIEYNKTDFTTLENKYDIIFDTVGKSSFAKCKKVLNHQGIYLATNGSMLINIFLNMITSIGNGKRFMFGMSVHKTEALNFIKTLLEEKKMQAVIDKVYSFDEIREAHRYVELGHKVGNVVINVSN
ncbi:MAG: NAD(P)-dependent alcohol dehydrogenase [Prolixibacteraceae bacterium]|jgi:NADPH:quinone reductase-like Zn-dependent oxidoreductase|nr:NAD(P)-dependent alcohol dehydrogenase [Prolixibacteraceae bacterium]